MVGNYRKRESGRTLLVFHRDNDNSNPLDTLQILTQRSIVINGWLISMPKNKWLNRLVTTLVPTPPSANEYSICVIFVFSTAYMVRSATHHAAMSCMYILLVKW